MRPSFRCLGRPPASAVMAGAILLAGCAVTAPTRAPALAEAAPDAQGAAPAPTVIAPDLAGSAPVVRYGRYTLVELVPEPAQRDLMGQVVETELPAAFDTRVGDALRHVLLRSGYRLCDSADAAALYALPLPAAHLHLGPLALRDALLTLAGPAWQLSVDDAARQVCFRRPAASTTPSAAPSAPAASAAPGADRAQAAADREEQP